MVKITLRALHGCTVRCSHIIEDPVFSYPMSGWLIRARVAKQGRFFTSITYVKGTLEVRIKNFMTWQGYNLSSRFDVFFNYCLGERMDANGTSPIKHKVTVAGARAFLLHKEFLLGLATAAFSHDNEKILCLRLPAMQSLHSRYRAHFHHVAQRKREAVDIFVEGFYLTHKQLSSGLSESSCVSSLCDLTARF